MKPNPILAPVKEYVRRYGGWGKRFTALAALPTSDSLGNRVFPVWHGDRRFAVVATSADQAHARLDILLS